MRLYMDVDGVVNAWYADRAWGLGMESEDVCAYVLAWSAKMVRRLGSLLDGGDLELIWLSGWGKDSLFVAEAVGWGMVGRVLGPVSGELTFPSAYWKAEALWEDAVLVRLLQLVLAHLGGHDLHAVVVRRQDWPLAAHRAAAVALGQVQYGHRCSPCRRSLAG